MKVMWVSNFLREEGRGPLFRLLNMMEPMSDCCELTLASFGPMDDDIKEYADRLGVPYFTVNYEHKGWFVTNADEIADSIIGEAVKRNTDIIVLTWEIWDIALAIKERARCLGIKFAVVMHSVPFVGMLRKKHGFIRDILVRAMRENQFMIKKYLLTRARNCRAHLKEMNIITMTPTVQMRLNEYMDGLKLFTAYPGYAADVSPRGIAQRYDFSFMARFEQGKGIYRLIKILSHIKKQKKDFSLVMIGTFTYKNDEEKFKRLLEKHGLTENVIFTGWLDGEEKYSYLEASRIFIYPSYEGDTFSISCLEALGMGKKIVCYDAPFVRCNYAELDNVFKIRMFDDSAFADKCVALLGEGDLFNSEGVEFARNRYSGWDEVAKAEYNCYLQITGGED